MDIPFSFFKSLDHEKINSEHQMITTFYTEPLLIIVVSSLIMWC